MAGVVVKGEYIELTGWKLEAERTQRPLSRMLPLTQLVLESCIDSTLFAAVLAGWISEEDC